MTIEKLKTLIEYCPKTGKFTWIKSTHPKQIVGNELGSLNNGGYITISVNKNVYYAHRLAWAFHYGKWPEGVIDHINLNPSDNRISNLRDTSRRVNQENRILPQSNNSTSLLGAFKYKNKYRSQIKAKGILYHLGVFSTAEEAHEAYIKAKRILHEGNTL